MAKPKKYYPWEDGPGFEESDDVESALDEVLDDDPSGDPDDDPLDEVSEESDDRDLGDPPVVETVEAPAPSGGDAVVNPGPVGAVVYTRLPNGALKSI